MTSPSLPVQTFMQEAVEVLETLEARLLELEDNPGRADLVDAVFRSLHTLKGSGEMFGFTALAQFTHSFENAYDAVRSGKAAVTPELIDISLRSRDHIQKLIDAGADPSANAALAGAPEGAALLAEIARIAGGDTAAERAGPAATDPDAEADPETPVTWRLRVTPDRGALRTGMRPDLLIEEIARLGPSEFRLDLSAVPPLEALEPTDCHLVWEGWVSTSASRAEIEDVFLFAEDETLSLSQEPQGSLAPGAPPPAAEVAHDRGTDETGRAVSSHTDRDVSAQASQPRQPVGAPAPDAEAARPVARKSDSVRVQAHRLDSLMDQLGELVIAQARLNRIAKDLADPTLVGTAEEIERLITGLRDATLSIRMLPIGTVFGKFRRVVRDLSSELGKEVALVTSGEDTELDKNVIDSLSEPLVHIVRNSVDHGIEALEVRRAAGKPDIATVRMGARQSGGEVLVTVSDDGGGLKTERIRARAVERGLIAEGDDLSEAQINQLIFAPGFSTAESLSSVSGRGVGMDAVRNVIQELGGAVDVASERGHGTEITLKLPLTLAIIEGLLVRVAGASYVLPLSSVEECAELSTEETRRESGRAILTIRDELVPFLDLEALFGAERDTEEGGARIVIVRAGGRRVGLVVDDIVGQHQTVIKSLSPYHRDIAGLAGGTILGDGSVALILDPVALVKSAAADTVEAA